MRLYRFKERSLLVFNQRVLIFLLIIVQSCGIRFFDGIGSVITFAVILYSAIKIKKFELRDAKMLFYIFLILFGVFFLAQNFFISSGVYLYGLVLEVYLFLLTYRNKVKECFVLDFFHCLNIIFLHAGIGYFMYFIFSTAYTPHSFNYQYNSLLSFFYVSKTDSGLVRNTGILWEPGLLQLMMNLFLFYNIKRNSPVWMLLSIVAVIVSTFSTAGYMILGLNCLFFIYHNYRTRRSLVIGAFTLLLIFSGSLYFVIDNVRDKFSQENTSGLVRLRDSKIGIELIKESPFFGHGLFDAKYLFTKGYVSQIELGLFSDEYLSISGDMGGGFTNGLLGIFCWFGLPLGLIIYIAFFKNKFVGSNLFERSVFFLILCLSFVSEPITYTAFFLLFPFSYFLFRKSNRAC